MYMHVSISKVWGSWNCEFARNWEIVSFRSSVRAVRAMRSCACA